MSRFDSDLDYADWLEGPYVRTICVECRAEFSRAFDDPTDMCVECWDVRDAHTAALERRLTTLALTAVTAALAKKAGAA